MNKTENKAKLNALFGDLLIPTPKGVKNASPKKAIVSAPVNPAKNGSFIAESRQYHLVEQECLTCGTITKYALTKIIRYRASRRKDGLAIELPMLLPPAIELPSDVIQTKETTDFCSCCVYLSKTLDSAALFELSSGSIAKQMELFK